MPYGRPTVFALALLVSAACERDRAPRYPTSGPYPQQQPPYGQPYPQQPPYGSYPQQPPYGQPYPQQPPPYGQPAPQPAPQPTLLGTALTGFGVLLGQLPQIPAQLPPLPQWDASQPWPFPFPLPGQTQPAPQPAPTPAPAPAPAPTPAPAPPSSSSWPAQWAQFEDEVLALTNQRRAQGALCGSQSFGPAGPVSAHPALRGAARGHSQDMAQRNYFDHASPEGTSPMQRAKAAGYPGTFVGENIAAGQTTPSEVVAAWVKSPGHCVNLMDPRFLYLGVGYVFEQSDKYRHYWTQNFGG